MSKLTDLTNKDASLSKKDQEIVSTLVSLNENVHFLNQF